jgi:hypothetical protein
MATVQRQHSLRGKPQYHADADTQRDPEASASSRAEQEEGASRSGSRMGPRSPTMDTVREEYEGQSPKKGSRRNNGRDRSDSTPRPPREQKVRSKADEDDSDAGPSETRLAGRSGAGNNSYRSLDLSGDSSLRSPETSASDLSSQVVNFSRKPTPVEPNTMQSPDSWRTDSMNEFYDDSSVHFAPIADKEPTQVIPITRFAPSATRRVEIGTPDSQQRRMVLPPKAASRLGGDDRSRPRLAHIEEVSIKERPESSTSDRSGSSRGKSKRPVTQISLAELARIQPLDFSQPWSTFWRVTQEELRKPPHGYSIGLQELWWKLLQLEEHYHQSLQMLYSLITSDSMNLPSCSITPTAIQKLQASHDKFLRQPLREAMGVGPWTFEYSAIIKAYQMAHAHLVPLYERFSWDVPLVTFQVAASSLPAASASRDLLLSIGPGMPTRYTCLRSPLTHVCATFDNIQSLYDGMYKGGERSVPNYAQILFPVREQIRSLIASCNRNVLLRWDDLRRSNLFGSSASRDIAVVTKELIFPPSQRKNIVLLNLGSPTRAVISRADLHWKASPSGSWSKCHAILLNNYLILASTSDSKGPRQHQIYHLVSRVQQFSHQNSADMF